MNYEELRPLTLETLKRIQGNNNLQTKIIIIEVENYAKSKGLNFTREDKDKVLHIVSELITQGILGWGLNYDNAEPPFLHISEYGKIVIESGKQQPYDPEGYLTYLKSQIPSVDDIIVTYITEAVQTLRTNNVLSAAVMLGVASERAFDLLLDALISSTLLGPSKPNFEKLKERANIKQKFDETKKVIIQHKEKLPEDLEENLDSNLDGIFNLIRETRNDAGHPTGKRIMREQAFVNLQLFVPYCKCVYGLIDFLKKNMI